MSILTDATASPSIAPITTSTPRVGLQPAVDLQPGIQVSPQQVEQRTNYFNHALLDTDRLRTIDIDDDVWKRLFPGGQRPIWPVDPEHHRETFPNVGEQDKRVHDATEPNANDSDAAKQVKQDYRAAWDQLNKEVADAKATAERLGPGTHTGPNGEKITVSKTDDGTIVVTTKQPNGTSKTVTCSPGHDKVDYTDENGKHESLERDGTKITRRKGDWLDNTWTSYDVDGSGGVVRERGHDHLPILNTPPINPAPWPRRPTPQPWDEQLPVIIDGRNVRNDITLFQ